MDLQSILTKKRYAARLSRYGVSTAPPAIAAVFTAPNMVSGVLGAPPAEQIPTSAPVAAAEALEKTALPTFTEGGDNVPGTRFARSGGLIKTERNQGVGKPRFPGSMAPQGESMKRIVAYAKRKPVVSDGVAKIIDGAQDLDHIQGQILMLRRAANLYAKGFRHSAELDVIVPPNYQAGAVVAGLPQPNIDVEITGALPAEQAPAEVVNISQGYMTGTQGDPQARFREEVASKQPKMKSVRKSLAVGAVAAAGVNAVGYTPEVSYQGTVAGNAALSSVGVGLGEGNAAVAAEAPSQPSTIQALTKGKLKRGLFAQQ